ncbi:MAG: hypothetical protein ACYTDU_01315 [Planctomycetota bacterium]|jgi:hypothetical protein
MPWRTNPLTIQRCLQDIQQLVADFPPSDPALQTDVDARAGTLISGTFPLQHELRTIRVFRAYGYAGIAVNQPAGSRNGAWASCLDELDHAQAGT